MKGAIAAIVVMLGANGSRIGITEMTERERILHPDHIVIDMNTHGLYLLQGP